MTDDHLDLVEHRLGAFHEVEPPDIWKRVVSMSPTDAEATASTGGWLVTAAVVTVLALGVAVLAMLDRGTGSQRVVTPPADEPGPESSAEPPTRDAGPATTDVGTPPIEARMAAAVVWTGTELVLWGGYDLGACCGAPDPATDAAYTDGAVLDPVAGGWRSLEPAPVPLSFGSSHAVATPEGVVVARDTSVALLASDDSWRALPDAPGPVRDLQAVASTVVSVSAGGALTLGSDTWRPLAGPPVDLQSVQSARLGGEVAVIGLAGGPGCELVGRECQLVALGYDPVTDAWRTLPPLPTDTGWHTFRVGSDGARLVVVTGRGHAMVLETGADSWTAVETVPGEVPEWFESPLVVAGGTTVVAMGDRLAVRSAEGTWRGVADRSRPVPFGREEPAVRWVELVAGPASTAFAVSIDPVSNANEVVALDLDVLTAPAVELSLVAVSPNQRRIVNLDLSAGRASELAHLDSMSPLSGATMTSRGDLVVWGPPAYVFRDGDLTREPVELLPTRLHDRPGVADAVLVVPTPDGRRLWMVQPAMDLSLLDLVDVASGEVVLHLELEPRAFPVDAVPGGLLVHTDPLDRTDTGFVDAPERRRTVLVSVDGTVEEVREGWTSAGNERHLVVGTDPSGAPSALEIIDRESGSVARFDPPGSGPWLLLGGPAIPSHARPLRTLAADGRLIVAVTDSRNPDGYPSATTLVLLSPADGAIQELASFEGRPPLATWSRDDRHVVVIDGSDVLVVDPDAASAMPRRVATVPDGTWVLGAG